MRAARKPRRSSVSSIGVFLYLWLSAGCHLTDTEPEPPVIPIPEPPSPNSVIVDSWPAWSPDGFSIAYYRVVPSSAGPPGIYVVRTDGTGNQLLLASAAWLSELRFSPDGTQLNFTLRSEIYLLDLREGGLRQLTTTDGNASSADWCPDGRSIVITTPFIRDGGLHVIDVRSGAARALTSGGRRLYGWDPRWSPDGEPIVFTLGDREGHHEIFSIRSDGSDFRQLTNAAAEGGLADHPQWVYGGSHLLYLWRSRDSTRRETRLIRSDGSEQRTWPLLLLLYGFYDAISPDSRRVASPGPQDDSTRIHDRKVWVLFTRDLDDGGGESRRRLTSYLPAHPPD